MSDAGHARSTQPSCGCLDSYTKCVMAAVNHEGVADWSPTEVKSVITPESLCLWGDQIDEIAEMAAKRLARFR